MTLATPSDGLLVGSSSFLSLSRCSRLPEAMVTKPLQSCSLVQPRWHTPHELPNQWQAKGADLSMKPPLRHLALEDGDLNLSFLPRCSDRFLFPVAFMELPVSVSMREGQHHQASRKAATVG